MLPHKCDFTAVMVQIHKIVSTRIPFHSIWVEQVRGVRFDPEDQMKARVSNDIATPNV